MGEVTPSPPEEIPSGLMLEWPSPPERGDGEEVRRVLVTALDRLPARQMVAVLLRFIDGQTYREVGRVMQCSPRRARSLCCAAMKRLRMPCWLRALRDAAAEDA